MTCMHIMYVCFVAPIIFTDIQMIHLLSRVNLIDILTKLATKTKRIKRTLIAISKRRRFKPMECCFPQIQVFHTCIFRFLSSYGVTTWKKRATVWHFEEWWHPTVGMPVRRIPPLPCSLSLHQSISKMWHHYC